MNASFARQLNRWYTHNKRPHPWLGSKNAYMVWLSEVIMQQTRIGHGTNYFLKFARRFPTVSDLANANEDEILKMWEGLGYYSRARNMLHTAIEINDHFKGEFPTSFEQLIKLKGIGTYTASAILSFAYDQPYAVVDGNVLRILARVFGLHEPVDTPDGKKKFEQLAQRLIDKKAPGKYNQAIMDFGALVCTPQSPGCDNCPFSKICYAFNNNKTDLLPVKIKKVKKMIRYFNYFVITDGKRVLVEKRNAKDIWLNLYQFPLMESKKRIIRQQLKKSKQLNELVTAAGEFTIESSYQSVQELTHQRIHATFYKIRVNKFADDNRSRMPVSAAGMKKLAFPGVIRDYLKEIPIFNN